MSYKIKQSPDGGIEFFEGVTADSGTVNPPATGSITAKHAAFGPFKQLKLTLADVPQSVVNGTEYQSTLMYTLPEGRVYVIGAVATLQQKTTSALASTLNSGSTGAIGVGTAAASSTTLSTTMQDIIPTTAFTSSTTINVAGTAVNAVLASPAVFDGTSSAKKLYLNTAYATTTDVDGNATQTISGTVTVTYVHLGDY